MIPEKLTISGFLSYQEPAELDFSGLHVACITGQNGAGKSAMLDAMTWALFGEARKNDDSIINDLQEDRTAKVEFEFSYEGARYLVRRQKTRGKSTTAEFYIRSEDGREWKALTEKKVTDTNKRICSTLHMDYKTFINASFFLQGKADQFTGQNATERKKILSTILNLEVWESYKAKASEKRKETEASAAYLRKLMLEADEELQNEAELLKAQEEIRVQVKEAEKRQAEADLKWKLAKTAESSLETLRTAMEQKQRDEQRQERQVRILAASLETRSGELQMLRARLTNAETIEKKYAQLLAVREELEKLNAAGMEFSRLDSLRNGLRSEIRSRENQLRFELDQLTREQAEIQQKISERKQLVPQIEADRTRSKVLAESCVQLPALREEFDGVNARGGQFKAEFIHLDEKEQEIRGKLERLLANKGALCPTCGRELDAEHCRKHAAELNEEIAQVNAERQRKEAERVGTRARYSQLRAQITQMEKLNQELSAIQVTLGANEQKVRMIDEQLRQWDSEKKARLSFIEASLQQGDFCTEERRKLAGTETALNELNYDPKAHENARGRMKDLSGAEKEHQELITDQSRIGPMERDISEQKTRLEEEKTHLETLREERTKAEESWRKQRIQMPDISQIEKERNEAAQLLGRLNREEGGIRQRVENLAQAHANLERYGAEFKEKSVLIERLKSLEKAFGKDGIPALLIEQAIPEIEEQANKLLQQLTNGTMSLRMNTQGEYKSKKDELKETLDILISDPYGIREYEMFSGGEAFRINFSIRLALSRILAQRAGSRLQTLVIDEGFGSQDEEGRARLAEAITAVQNDFEKILVITHLTELKETFPARIEVEKTAKGSHMEVVL